ncbi:hypothetical protein Tco_0236452 [Tanacetum coccineum]
MGTVAEYHNEFEMLINRVTGISESLLKSFYIFGLKVAFQIELLRVWPTTLGEAFSLARITEARFEDERSATTIVKPNDLNTRVEVQDLEEMTRHKPNKVEAIKTSGSILLVESKYYATNQVGLIFNQSNEATYYERIFELIAEQLCQYLYLSKSGRRHGKQVFVVPDDEGYAIDVNDEPSDDDFVDMGESSSYGLIT